MGFALFCSHVFLQVSGRCFPLKPGNQDGIKGKNLVEAWEKVLVTSGCTDYAKKLRKSGPQKNPENTRIKIILVISGNLALGMMTRAFLATPRLSRVKRNQIPPHEESLYLLIF